MWRESITCGRVRVSARVIDYILIVSFGSWRKISKCRHKKKIHNRDILNLSLLLLILPLRFSFFSFSMLSEALSAALAALRAPALRDLSGRCPHVWCCCSPASRTALLPILCPSSALWSVVGLCMLLIPGGKQFIGFLGLVSGSLSGVFSHRGIFTIPITISAVYVYGLMSSQDTGVLTEVQ